MHPKGIPKRRLVKLIRSGILMGYLRAVLISISGYLYSVNGFINLLKYNNKYLQVGFIRSTHNRLVAGSSPAGATKF